MVLLLFMSSGWSAPQGDIEVTSNGDDRKMDIEPHELFDEKSTIEESFDKDRNVSEEERLEGKQQQLEDRRRRRGRG